MSAFGSTVSKRAVDESETEAAERRSLRCVWVAGGRALTEKEAAAQIVSEARLLLQEDLAQLGVQWDPTSLSPGGPAVKSPVVQRSSDTELSAQTDNTKDHPDVVRLRTGRDIMYHLLVCLLNKDPLLFSQVSPGLGGDDDMNENECEGGGNDNQAINCLQVASDSLNRSSSFLFDSLYDSSLLAGLSPQQTLDQLDEDESEGQEVKDQHPLPSNQARRCSELLANQESEKQEALQWGESFLNLSEWGDSLFVGEHFLERQSLLRHTERKQDEQKPDRAQESHTDNDLPEEQPLNSPPNSRPDLNHDHQLEQPKAAPESEQRSITWSRSKTKAMHRGDQNLSPPRHAGFPSPPQPRPLFDAELPLNDEGFSLQLSQDASHLCSSNSSIFSIIDVASDRRLFNTFIEEWRTRERYSLALACEKREHTRQPEGEIGGKHKRAAHQKLNQTDGFPVRDSDGLVLIGLSVCWGARDAYYISLQQDQSLSLSLAPPPLDDNLPVSKRLERVQACLSRSLRGPKQGAIVTYDIIQVYKTLVLGCGISLKGSCEDPKVACWLADPGSEERTLPNMVAVYCPEELALLDGLGNAHAHCPRVRAATTSVLVHAVMNHLTGLLEKDGMLDFFRSVEMPSQMCLALLELNGVGFSVRECERQKHVMQAKLTALESQAYNLAGHSFSLTSIDDIAQVLFLELHLPPNGDVSGSKSKKTLGYTRRGGGRVRLGKQFSTTKDVLEKLCPLHPLPGVILEWRRITNALTKVVFPLQREKQYHPTLTMDRIYPIAQTHTATGRVSFTEPNIQNVPKDFEINMPTVVDESPPSQNGYTFLMCKDFSVTPTVTQIVGFNTPLSPFQLELRVLAHLSKDQRLLQVLNGGADVFRCIAAEWKSVDPESVNDKLRQQAKQICYGIIYGMGAKSLGEQMGVDEDDAASYIESFKARYKGINAFLKETVKNCIKSGYVQTLMGRRRYLAGITNTNTHIKAHAERQAVNTTVQGSAADIVKLATVNIQKQLQKIFPAAPLSHQHTHSGDTLRMLTHRTSPRKGAYFVLQLHDELIYETTEEDLIQVAHIVKREMETAVKLYVKLKAKVKVGPSWGNLQDLDL
uniref:DNA-directed DNA polymerase n=1 Tax=Echeneis naucrates TaxID=173247 RepID=A0A665WQY9_ECHNA